MQLLKCYAALACLVLGVPGFCQEKAAPPSKAAPAPQAKTVAKPSRPVETLPPPGAVQVSERTWRWTDAKGKAWLFTKTPFGWNKREDTKEEEAVESPAKAANEAAPELRVEGVENDVVTFSRQMPFGRSHWTRKMAELTDDERTAYEKSSFAQSEKK